MNRNHLALFHAVAQAGGITQGAAAARISQPAVSKQITELESALGVRLLERLPRGCELTEAGRILADHARRWCALEQDATRAIEEYRGLKRGRGGQPDDWRLPVAGGAGGISPATARH
jgi:DNA-binding transcriptional LysR family regulator